MSAFLSVYLPPCALQISAAKPIKFMLKLAALKYTADAFMTDAAVITTIYNEKFQDI